MSVWDSVKKAIGTIAPIFASALGTPLAGGLVAAFCAQFLGDANAKPEDVLKFLGNPDNLIKIKQFETELQEKYIQAGIDIEQLENQEMESARNREKTLAATGHPDNTQKWLAFLITLGFFAFLALVSFVPTQSTVKDIIFGMVGSLGTVWIQMVSYYFGSSKGSERKDSTIQSLSQPTVK